MSGTTVEGGILKNKQRQEEEDSSYDNVSNYDEIGDARDIYDGSILVFKKYDRDPTQQKPDTRDPNYSDSCLQGRYKCYGEKTRMMESDKWYRKADLQDVVDDATFAAFSKADERKRILTQFRKIIIQQPFSEFKRFGLDMHTYVNASSGDWPHKFAKVSQGLQYDDTRLPEGFKPDAAFITEEIRRRNDALKSLNEGLKLIIDQLFTGEGCYTQRTFEVHQGLTWDSKGKRDDD